MCCGVHNVIMIAHFVLSAAVSTVTMMSDVYLWLLGLIIQPHKCDQIPYFLTRCQSTVCSLSMIMSLLCFCVCRLFNIWQNNTRDQLDKTYLIVETTERERERERERLVREIERLSPSLVHPLTTDLCQANVCTLHLDVFIMMQQQQLAVST